MESIEELVYPPSAGEGGDQLLPPPTNPAGPPQAIADMIRNSAQRNVDWVKTPGRVMQGVTPTVPGQWSEEDEFRQQSLNQHQYDWGAQTAFSDVFWPRAGGTGQVTSGAGSKITQPTKRTTVQGAGSPVEVGKGASGIEVPAGWKVTPVEHDPFAGKDWLGSFDKSMREEPTPLSVVPKKPVVSEVSQGTKVAGDIPQQIRKAFYDIAGNPPMDSVRLNTLRDKLPNIPREQFDAALLQMKNSREANLMNLDNPRDIRGVGDAKLSDRGRDYHVLWLEHDPFLTSLTQAPEKIYVGSLQEAESRAIKAGDEQSFFSVLDQLKNDPTLKVADMQAIAKQYGDGFPLEKTKKGALDYIRMKFFERAYQAAKMVQVDKGSKF